MNSAASDQTPATANCEIDAMLKAVEELALNMHNKHFELRPETGVVNPKESPNENTVYHVFNDGTMEYTKGGWAYLQRSIFTANGAVLPEELSSKLTFPKRYQSGNPEDTYVMLTEKEADLLHAEMRKIARLVRELKESIVMRIKKLHEQTVAKLVQDKLCHFYSDGSIYRVVNGGADWTLERRLAPTEYKTLEGMQPLDLNIHERGGASYCILPLDEAVKLREELVLTLK